MRLVFCGTPAFAVPTLHALLAAGHSIPLVLCQPDRPAGRGMVLTAPPVKRAALDAGLEVQQPERLRTNPELAARLTGLAPEAIVVVAYGRLIPPWMLRLPPLGNLNLHGSLLPKYRGAAPIQWAVAQGETVSGVTTMRLDEGMDTGAILLRRETAIGPDETAEDLYVRLAELGAPLMVETLAGLARGEITPRPQDDAQASTAPLLTREDGRVDASRSAREIYNRWRGFQPWPGAWTTVRGRKLTLSRLRLIPGADEATPDAGLAMGLPAEPGVLRVLGGRLYFAAGDGGWLEVLELQMEGRRRMPAGDLLRGQGVADGERLGT